ncbi:hypothetical protein L3Q82_015345, partial [Scortum barcoo]
MQTMLKNPRLRCRDTEANQERKTKKKNMSNFNQSSSTLPTIASLMKNLHILIWWLPRLVLFRAEVHAQRPLPQQTPVLDPISRMGSQAFLPGRKLRQQAGVGPSLCLAFSEESSH